MRNIKKKQAKIIEKVREEFSEDALKELKKEGIPEHIIYSFMQSAKETSSTVLSRVPGGAGLDLIEDGYDLKSFHIKAKSCDWGPMAGFICQIPILNKKGYDYLDYNTNEIGAYLKHLDSFKSKAEIKNLESDKSKVLINIKKYFNLKTGARNITKKHKKNDIFPIDHNSELNEILNEIEKKNKETENSREKNIRENIIKVFAEEIQKLLKPKNINEIKTGEWTGENTIEDSLPFIALKRNFGQKPDDALAKVKLMQGVEDGVEHTTKNGIEYIAGTAIHKKGEKASVKMDFLLRKKEKESLCWEIYHGNVFYRTEINDEWVKFGLMTKDKVSDDNQTKYGGGNGTINYLKKIFSFPSSDGEDYIKNPFKIKVSEKVMIYYLPLKGFVNPHPPFRNKILNKKKIPNPDYYKNAVTGDYDLFAIWPKMEINPDELIRKSEFSIGKPLRMGGKIFTQYFGNKCNFGIEFIPGFAELNANVKQKDKDENEIHRNIAHEFQDFGNPHSWEMLVCGYLNSFAGTFSGRSVPVGNKAFHSDEGGRPGIMEVEFPVAVFFPNKFKSKALNNTVINDEIIPLKDREEIEVYGGLIKSADELVAIALELMEADFRVFLHNGWFMHLLYLSLDSNRKIRMETLKNYLKNGIEITDIKDPIKILQSELKFKNEVGKKEAFVVTNDNHINQAVSDFDTIDKAKEKFDGLYYATKIVPDYDYFLERLMELLIANYKINDQVKAADFFEPFRIAMLTHFFQNKKLALDKKEEIVKIMRASPIDYNTIVRKIK